MRRSKIIMSKAAVIFWSQTGNTEQMANAIADGIREGGMEVDVLNVADTTPADAVKYAKIALGCPAMGAEVLEETEFDPFFTELESKISGLKVALFGSYGWGDGQWMRDWVQRTNDANAVIYMRASSSTKPRTTTASQSARSSARASQHSKQSRNSLNALHITCAKRNFDRICKANP